MKFCLRRNCCEHTSVLLVLLAQVIFTTTYLFGTVLTVTQKGRLTAGEERAVVKGPGGVRLTLVLVPYCVVAQVPLTFLR